VKSVAGAQAEVESLKSWHQLQQQRHQNLLLYHVSQTGQRFCRQIVPEMLGILVAQGAFDAEGNGCLRGHSLGVANLDFQTLAGQIRPLQQSPDEIVEVVVARGVKVMV
jgi:hypothetical protein